MHIFIVIFIIVFTIFFIITFFSFGKVIKHKTDNIKHIKNIFEENKSQSQKENKILICEYCGTANAEDNIKCSSCGAKLKRK